MADFYQAAYTDNGILLFSSNQAAKNYFSSKGIINGSYCMKCLGKAEVTKQYPSLNFVFYCYKCKEFYITKSNTSLHQVSMKFNKIYALIRLWADDFTPAQAFEIVRNYFGLAINLKSIQKFFPKIRKAVKRPLLAKRITRFWMAYARLMKHLLKNRNQDIRMLEIIKCNAGLLEFSAEVQEDSYCTL